ncbi:NAD(P)-binding protein [Hypomontagnella monticulosa]|nr:NAD(P)-binding protein [Hypomontagnella monticulosa]
MPISGRPAPSRLSENHVFLLTGSTGPVGSYILDSLQIDPRVLRIYCLSHGPDSLNRQQESQSAMGLQPVSWIVRCLDGDLSKPYFGLSPEEYRELLSKVTHVIHNAWQVDFNLTIDSFVNSIYSVRQLIEFSAHSFFGAQLFFVSSISSVGGRTGAVAERIFWDWSTPEALGYGQSKFVSELLLDTAAREAEIPTIVCRVGQISGPTTTKGMWPKQEWLPSLIASSKYLGKIPYSLGHMETIDWIPVDVLGKAIAELANRPPEEERGATVYHVLNPQHTSWGDLLHIVMKYLSREKVIETVSLEEWLKALRESAPRTEDLSRNPAVKLLDFFESLAGRNTQPALLNTSNSILASQALTGLGPVREEWMENWMRQWAF